MGDLRRLIAFDLDGTLVNSRRDLADSANELIVELGGAPLSEDAVGRMVGEGARVLVERALAASGLHTVDAARSLPRFLEIYDGRLLRHTREYDGIGDAVARARTHACVIVLTNKPRRPSEQILAGLGLRVLFDDVIGGDGPWPRKPDPAGLRAVMAREGIAPERTLLVGDSAIDLQTARRAGALACFAAYGFGGHTLSNAVPADVWVADTPADLVPIFGAFSAGARPAPAASKPPASRS